MNSPEAKAAMAHVRALLGFIGDDPEREGLVDTPSRVVKAMYEHFWGYSADPIEPLQRTFAEIEGYDELVLLQDIEVHSHCEHHMVPFVGKAHVAYIPNGRVVGLSKLARVVEDVSHRPQVQERLTETIADLLENDLGAKGVAVVVEATHTCMTIRGVRKPGSLCVTSAMKGVFRSNVSSRAEVLSLIYGRRTA